jgi:hypothetical protein
MVNGLNLSKVFVNYNLSHQGFLRFQLCLDLSKVFKVLV